MTSSSLSDMDGVWLDGLEFCSKVYAHFEHIRQSEGGPSGLRMRVSKVEKKLVEELLPICKYVQAKYRPGRYISVCWLSGDQPFDAEVRQTGGYVDEGFFPEVAYLEATCVVHPNDYLSRELLNSGGAAFGPDGIRRLKTREIVSEPVVHENAGFIQSYGMLVLKQIAKKASIIYPADTSLIVQCTLNRPLYTLDEWEMLLVEVQRGLPNHGFREIFMYDPVLEYSRTLQHA